MPFSNKTLLEIFTFPPTAIVFSFSIKGTTMLLKESLCNTESASNVRNNGYVEALIPIFKASAFPPFSLFIKVIFTFSNPS